MTTQTWPETTIIREESRWEILRFISFAREVLKRQQHRHSETINRVTPF